MSHRLGRRAFLAGAASLGLAACAQAVPNPTPGASLTNGPKPQRPSSPLAARPADGIWPDFYAKSSRDIQEAYTYAVAHRDTLKWMPCYCGCGAPGHGANGHGNNFDCYVQEQRSDGWFILDQHAYG